MATHLRSLRVTKIALCPRGKNPDAHIVMYKEDTGSEIPAEDFAGPSRTYPVATPDDVAAAARATDALTTGVVKSAQTRRLIRIAVRKGEAFAAHLPPTWALSKDLFSDILTSVEQGRRKSDAWDSVLEYLDCLRWALSTSVWTNNTVNTSEAEKSIGQFASAVADVLNTLTKEDTSVTKKYTDMSKEELVAELTTRDTAAPKTDAAPATLTKEQLESLSEPVRKMIEAQNVLIEKAQADAKAAQDAVTKATEDARVEKEKRENIENIEKAKKDFSHLPGTDEEKALLVKAVSHLPKTEADVVEKCLKAGEAALVSLGKENGHDETTVTGEAIEKLNSIAKELITKDSKLTFAIAFDKACQQNPDLYQEHRKAQRRADR